MGTIMKPFFSVIIPTYNSAEKLVRAIKSVLSQTYKNYEIIIVDDGSSDNTAQVVKEIAQQDIRYIYKANGGPASARNMGIRTAFGKYICFLDADDEFMPDKLKIFYDICLNNEVFLYTDAVYIDEVKNSSYLFSNQVSIFQGHCFNALMNNNFIVTSTVCIKRIIFDEIGYFNENVQLKFVEDYDLWLKITNKYPLTYINQPLTRYYIHQSNNSSNIQRTVNSLIIIYMKWSLTSFVAIKKFLKYMVVKLLYLSGMKK